MDEDWIASMSTRQPFFRRCSCSCRLPHLVSPVLLTSFFPLPPSLPPSLTPSLPPSLSPSLPPSLPPSSTSSCACAASQLGSQAPAFSVMDQNGTAVTLESFKGQKNVVVFFYPKDNTVSQPPAPIHPASLSGDGPLLLCTWCCFIETNRIELSFHAIFFYLCSRGF